MISQVPACPGKTLSKLRWRILDIPHAGTFSCRSIRPTALAKGHPREIARSAPSSPLSKYMSINDHPHPHGIMVGGGDLGTTNVIYL